jgi:uncharacterized phage protein (predicted DNA packaging)
MALLDDVKQALRISSSAFNTEITDLITAARHDLRLSGVLPTLASATNPDPLIKRYITTYVKANFGMDNPDSEKLMHAAAMLKAHLTLSAEYTEDEAS